MALSKNLISDFVKATTDNKKAAEETTLYGTIVEYGGSKYVRLDGSDVLTPYTATVAAKAGERVRVSVGNHTAMVTGNVSSPAARTGDVEELGQKVESFDAVIADKATVKDLEVERARVDDLVADNVTIKKQLTADSADIKDLKADNADIKGTLTANAADIENLKANKIDADTVSSNYATIKSLEATQASVKELTAATGRIDNLESKNIETDKLVAKKADIDLANVNNAWIEKGVLKDGSIGSAAIHEGAVTNAKIADATIEAAKIKSINADSIVAGTIKTERLIITGPDGQDSIVKAINLANGVSEAEVNSQKIQAASIDVIDLSAFQAKIAQFDLSQNAIYSGKTSITDPTSGVYISTTGFGLGDGSLTSKKESPIQMYADGVFKLKGKNSSLEFNPVTDMLDINVSNFRIGSKEAATTDDVGAVEKKIDDLQIGGRNLLLNTSRYAVNSPYSTTSNKTDNYIYSFDGKPIYTVRSFKAGDVITVQAQSNIPWASDHGNQSGKSGFWLYYGSADQVKQGGYTVAHFLKGDSKSTSFKQVVTIPSVTNLDDIYIAFRFNTYSDGTANVTGKFWNLKLEKGNTATDWTPAPEDSLESVDVEYYLSTSATSLSGGSWSTTAPTWVNGKYMWSRTVKIDGSGNKTYSPSENGVCIAGAKGDTGAKGDKGETGDTGPKGDTGAQGPQGVKGDTGPQGPQGVQGVKGTDGQTYYTWLKYADSPTSGMSDDPSGKKYIGFAYNKTTSTESTSYADYEWSLIKGDTGATGAKGDTGATGNGIKSITYYYARTTTQTAPAAGNITATTMPTLDATNKYLWQKEVITYTNNTAQTTVLLLAVYGNTGAKGDTGSTGIGIKSVVEQYYKSTSNTTQTGGSWITTYPGWENGKYIWTRSVITYTDNTSTTTTPICVTGSQGSTGAKGDKGEQGSTGPQGVSVTTIKDQWYKSTSNTAQTGGSWSDAQPSWEAGKYIWTRSHITFSNGNTTTTNPVLADAINNANANASNAVSTANTANSTANTAKSTADAAKSSAASAVSTANTANSTANTAKTTADTAKSTADAAKTTASNAASTASAAKSTADTAKSTADSANSSVSALDKIATKNYSVTGAAGKVKWVRLGTLTSAGDSKVVVISLQTGNGFNGNATQNAQAEIIIKDGWQQTASTTAAFGVSVTRQNTQTIDSNGKVTDYLLVSVRATASNVCEVWVYLGWTYWNGNYTISGIYENWNPNITNQDAKPTDGVEQDLAYRTTAEDAYHKAENVEKTVVSHSEFIKKSETWQMNWTNIISIDNVAVDKYQKYITFDNGTILLGHSAAASKVKITNDSIQFKGTSSTTVTPDSDATAWITGKVFHIDSGEIESSLTFGKVRLKPSSNNTLIIRDPDDKKDMAEFGSIIRIGESSGRNVQIDTNGLRVFNGSTSIAQIGYGTATDQNGNSVTQPFYTFGLRTSGSAVGAYSVAEGHGIVANGYSSHAEGSNTKASDGCAHAEGNQSEAAGYCSHAEGLRTKVTTSGWYAHAEGADTIASGLSSHAGGTGTIAASNDQTVIGRYNIKDEGGSYAFIMGNGSSNTARSNALIVDWSGNIAAPSLQSPGALNLGFNNGGSLYQPYLTKGDSVSGRIMTSGYVTNASTYVDFVVPLSKPVVGATAVSVASVNGLIVRQGNKYLFGSSASAYAKPSSYEATLAMGGHAVNIIAKMPNSTNVVSNNDACGIDAQIKLTFS